MRNGHLHENINVMYLSSSTVGNVDMMGSLLPPKGTNSINGIISSIRFIF